MSASAKRFRRRRRIAGFTEIFVPRGAAHGYTVGPAGGRVLVVTPAGLHRRVEYHGWRNILLLWRLASRRRTVSRMDRVAIRRATSSDVLVLLEMMAFFNAVEEIPWSAAVIEPALRHLLASPELGFVLVAMVGQKDVGYAVVTFNYDLKFAGRDAFVTELFVRPQHRRTGVARRLLAVIEANAGIEGTHARAKG